MPSLRFAVHLVNALRRFVPGVLRMDEGMKWMFPKKIDGRDRAFADLDRVRRELASADGESGDEHDRFHIRATAIGIRKNMGIIYMTPLTFLCIALRLSLATLRRFRFWLCSISFRWSAMVSLWPSNSAVFAATASYIE